MNASANKIKAERETNSIIQIADANKKAKVLAGEAEMEYADLISKNKYGPMFAQLNIQKEAISGMKQVAYLPEGCIPKLLTQGMFSNNGTFDIPELS